MTTQTTAQIICDRYDNNGQNWTDADGIELDVALDAITCREVHPTRGAIRWEFKDGSVIVIDGDGWDIEGAVPFSWAGT